MDLTNTNHSPQPFVAPFLQQPLPVGGRAAALPADRNPFSFPRLSPDRDVPVIVNGVNGKNLSEYKNLFLFSSKSTDDSDDTL